MKKAILVAGVFCLAVLGLAIGCSIETSGKYHGEVTPEVIPWADSQPTSR